MFNITKRHRAFTLVELLVVIGIIALLISVLLPALTAARRQANTVKCLAQLRQFGNAFMMYANDNNGYWPMNFHTYPHPVAPTTRAKRWPDFIGKYLNNGRVVNWDGTSVANAEQDTITSLKANPRSVFWGCPSFSENQRTYNLLTAPAGTYLINTVASTLHFGYGMNTYTFAPKSTAVLTNGYKSWANRSVIDQTPAVDGWYWKQSQWKRPATRALLLDNAHRDVSVGTGNPWWTAYSGWSTMPPVPDIFAFTIDFNRHGKLPIGNGYTQPSLNMLFCDGHAATVSCKQAHQAIRQHIGE
jgi:prepilin-type N-terminal cleavage/methylation domain-containing protein/prepilin-type processing-associated H-X9-DG protein